ncbi:MAE_28990/MAE_18760 family HEPN-like nuclease [Streptomyces olivaceus]|uniref:MAE_28990/MAE_18760 family HEPN-like nuclease n=1 Tax=Streptomyces olivaceus TaxID=47716 RepID=UPI00363E48D2
MPPTADRACAAELSSLRKSSLARSPIFDRSPLEKEFRQRIAIVRKLLDATDSSPGAAGEMSPIDVSRETRGLSIVLLYAAYENLLKGISRTLLESAVQLRLGNRRLKPEFQVFAIHSKLRALTDISATQIWKGSGRGVIDALLNEACSINSNIFPNDGSHMKTAQVATLCEAYGLNPPGPLLQEAWGRINTVVSERNSITHGQRTPEEIGRNYSIGDLRNLVEIWERRWCEFLADVESKASTRDFYRDPR